MKKSIIFLITIFFCLGFLLAEDNTKTDLDKISDSFSTLSKQGAIVSKPTLPQEFYYNMIVYYKMLKIEEAEKSFESYSKFNLPFIDPHIKYQQILKDTDGLDKAKNEYKKFLTRNKVGYLKSLYMFTNAILQEEKQEVENLEVLIKNYPDYAPAFYELSRLYSKDFRPKQTQSDKQKEYEYLTKFLRLNKEGKYTKYYIDRTDLPKNIEEATNRLKIYDEETVNIVKAEPKLELFCKQYDRATNIKEIRLTIPENRITQIFFKYKSKEWIDISKVLNYKELNQFDYWKSGGGSDELKANTLLIKPDKINISSKDFYYYNSKNRNVSYDILIGEYNSVIVYDRVLIYKPKDEQKNNSLTLSFVGSLYFKNIDFGIKYINSNKEKFEFNISLGNEDELKRLNYLYLLNMGGGSDKYSFFGTMLDIKNNLIDIFNTFSKHRADKTWGDIKTDIDNESVDEARVEKEFISIIGEKEYKTFENKNFLPLTNEVKDIVNAFEGDDYNVNISEMYRKYNRNNMKKMIARVEKLSVKYKETMKLIREKISNTDESNEKSKNTLNYTLKDSEDYFNILMQNVKNLGEILDNPTSDDKELLERISRLEKDIQKK